jgi:hypothetical protein
MFFPDPNFLHPGSKFFPSRIPDPYPDFLPIPDPGAKKAPDPGPQIRIRNTGFTYTWRGEAQFASGPG